MNKITKVKIGIANYIGAKTNKIEHIPDNMFNHLRYHYYNGVPLSFYILFSDIFTVLPFDRCVFFTKVLDEKDYQIVSADHTIIGPRSFIIANNKVYDVELGTITDKDYYFKLYKPTDLMVMEKDEVEALMKEYKIGESTLADAENVDLDKLDALDQKVKTYEGRHKELINRQVQSYFKDVNYEDGLMFLDINKKSM